MKPPLRMAALFLALASIADAQSLDRPTRLTVDLAGNIYVTEQPAGLTVGAVVVIAPSGTIASRIRSSGSTIADPGYFSSIRDLAIDAGGNLNLLDGVQKRILRMTTAGVPVGAIALPASSNASAFGWLPSGELLIADASSGRVLKLDASGNLLATYAVFTLPVRPNEWFDIAVDASGRLLVSDPTNNRILLYDVSGAQATPLGWLGGCNSGSRCVGPPRIPIGHTQGFCTGGVAQCGTPVPASQQSPTPGAFNRAFYVATDPAGDFYVTDLIQGVQHFSATGAVSAVLPRGRNVGQTGSGHVFVAANGDLYVADTGNNRVNRFSRAGAPLAVIGGGVDVSVVPGDSESRRLTLTEQNPSSAAVVTVGSLGYTGPATLVATSCLRETASPPYVPCSSYGIGTQLSRATVTLAAGGQDTSALTVSATTAVPRRTLNGRYLVAVSALDASGRLLSAGQAAVLVGLADRFGIVANPGRLTLFPGESADVRLALTNLSGVAGQVALGDGIAPSQAAGHYSATLTPRTVTTTTGTTVPTSPLLQIRLSEKARSGNPRVSVTARRGTAPIGSTTIDLQIDCNCRSTGAFVEPAALPVRVSPSDPLSGTSPSGAFVVNAGSTPGPAGPIPHVEIPGRVSQVTNAAAWGFSPNEKYFYVSTRNPSTPAQIFLTVYDLSGLNRIVQQSITLPGCAPGTACAPPPPLCYGGNTACLSHGGTNAVPATVSYAGWGFSPDDKTLLVAHLNPNVSNQAYTLLAYDLGRAHSAPMLNSQFSGGDAFWRFSPCGDMIMHFEQRAVGSAIVREARFWALDGGASPPSRLLATASYTGSTTTGGAPGASIVAASSIPTGSTGDFDVQLSNLAVQGSSRVDGFQSLQCRRR